MSLEPLLHHRRHPMRRFPFQVTLAAAALCATTVAAQAQVPVYGTNVSLDQAR